MWAKMLASSKGFTSTFLEKEYEKFSLARKKYCFVLVDLP